MKNVSFQKELVTYIEKKLKCEVVEVYIPPQGMSSKVFFIKTESKIEYVIKYGENAMHDVPALQLISKEKIDITIPQLYDFFTFGDCPVIVLEKMNSPLLESIPVNQMHRYIPTMIVNLKKIHQIKSDHAGPLNKTKHTNDWKTILLSKFNSDNSHLNWNKIAKRNTLNEKLVLSAVAKIVQWINNTQFIDRAYSLLHTDFNQRNLFVNPNSKKITGIIDWGEAMFGDPIYDFARVRMYIWHFKLEKSVLNSYNKLLSLKPEEKELEKLYWLSLVIEYLAYYSEEMNEFNTGRIKLHQDFLINYYWEK